MSWPRSWCEDFLKRAREVVQAPASQDEAPGRITTYAEIQELLDKIEVASKSGHAGDDEAWHLLDELWEGVLRGIADSVIEDPVGFAQWALKGLKSFGGPGT